ncbi:glycosyltransferase family 2 protein [Ilumatobacter sp.]|uniref:glycosyltransferase family 2 protein n=1 Tax=Ilumatobacter sp. TaxID=1967498 RepID=UPI003B529236
MAPGDTRLVTERREDPVASAIPSFSVVIPAFNREASIDVAIRSVLLQTEPSLEVIVVDDGSTDDTVAVVESIVDDRVRVIRLERNRGANAARNVGIEAARAPWIAFHDSDDEWLPRKLELQLRALSDNPSAIGAWCAMVVVDETPARSRSKFLAYVPDLPVDEVRGSFSRHVLERSMVSNQTLIVDAATIRAIGGYDESMPALQDWELVLRLHQRGELAFVDEPLVIQRLSTDSITRSGAKRVAARSSIVDKHIDLFSRQPDVLALNLYAIAGGWRIVGDRDRSTTALDRAIAVRPWWVRARLMRFAVARPSVDRAVSRFRALSDGSREREDLDQAAETLGDAADDRRGSSAG